MVTIARETLRLVAARHTAGDVGRFELLQAEQNSCCGRENQLHEPERRGRRARNSLALLFGRSPPCCAIANGVHCRLKRWLSRKVPRPAAVIARRPDVQAERRLELAHAGRCRGQLALSGAEPEAGLMPAVLFRRWFIVTRASLE